ncbi:winged helix-turn-helix domain-containing protein [Halegenticoccus tardaugens]|uniref:winged helix-turn-helix domain-containing protein n=1 Tax=Halegenticoccus tardaugens TaxID=2071624 RepID=UPI00100A9321|nr:helix-turn-helix domain-containing protein [Halegenticoccus tardaugens]
MNEVPDPADVFRLLDDEYARSILVETHGEPLSAKALSEACDASLPTIYRRVDDLKRLDLLVEHTQLDPSGNHYTLYESTVEHIDIDITNGEIDVTLTHHEDAADRFTRVWEDIRGTDR